MAAERARLWLDTLLFATAAAALVPLLPLVWPVLMLRRRAVLRPPTGRAVLREGQPANGGRFVRTSHGLTYVQLDEPSSGRVLGRRTVVLVHGNVGSTRYLDEFTAFLVAEGYRVLRYDLYGRGFSECSGRPHTWSLFVAQLSEVLLSLSDVATPIDLIGYSIGGQVAALFAATHPHVVARLVLLCPALLVPSWLPTLLHCSPLRFLAGRLVVRLLQQRDRYSSDWTCLTPSASGADTARVAASHVRLDALHVIECERCEHEPHLARSFGLSIADMPWGDGDAAVEAWLRLGRSAVEVHAFCGALDTTVDGPRTAKWLPVALGAGARLRVTLLDDVGHSLPYELPDVCAALVLPVLRAPDDATPVGEGAAVVCRTVLGGSLGAREDRI